MDPSLYNSTPIDILNATEDSSPCTHHLSSLACLTSARSNCICSCSLWCQCCSLAIAFSFHSRRYLSLALSRFISVELHSEKYSVVFIAQNFSTCANLKCTCTFFCLFNLNFLCLTTHTRKDMHTYTRVLQCSHASVGHSGSPLSMCEMQPWYIINFIFWVVSN